MQINFLQCTVHVRVRVRAGLKGLTGVRVTGYGVRRLSCWCGLLHIFDPKPRGKGPYKWKDWCNLSQLTPNTNPGPRPGIPSQFMKQREKLIAREIKLTAQIRKPIEDCN